MGDDWLKVKLKARNVVDGEILLFEFEMDTKVVFHWRKGIASTIFDGLSMRNGSGVRQWRTSKHLGTG